MIKPMITHEFLWEILDYDKDTGVLTWKERKTGSPYWTDSYAKMFNTLHAGKQAGCLVKYNRSNSTRRAVKLFESTYRSYRLIWLMMTGEWPKAGIDHIDQDSNNDRWNNLREATDGQNMKNTPMSKANTSGHVGVSERSNGKFRCRIQVDGIQYCKTFDTKEEAITERKRWGEMYGFTENHGRVKNG